jgi:hypothetical protein
VCISHLSHMCSYKRNNVFIHFWPVYMKCARNIVEGIFTIWKIWSL